MFEQVFKTIDDIIWKDEGCDSALDYAEQTSWMIFLKWLDDFEKDRESSAKLTGENYIKILSKKFRWSSWAVPIKDNREIDYDARLEGSDLKEFIDNELFPYLASLKENEETTNSIKYKIGEIFSKTKNKIDSGYIIRDVIEQLNKLTFRSNDERHELTAIYEDRIKKLGNAGRSGGQYYTPRPLIKAIIKIVDPGKNETIYDGAVGSAGFLVEAFEYIKENKNLTASDLKNLSSNNLYGVEKKSLGFILGIMNMILHGIESPNIIKKNTLEDNILDIQEKDKVDIVLANPPFGGKEREEIKENFPIKTGETAYLFLQHFIRKLKNNGRAGIVIKNTFLSNDDEASKNLRKLILSDCNLHTVLDLPGGVFQAGVKTVVLFFDKGKSTDKIWFYQLNLKRKLGKTNPLNDEDLKDFISLSSTKEDSNNSWSINFKDLDNETWDLSVNNPHFVEDVDTRTPEEIISEIEQLNEEAAKALKDIKDLL